MDLFKHQVPPGQQSDSSASLIEHELDRIASAMNRGALYWRTRKSIPAVVDVSVVEPTFHEVCLFYYGLAQARGGEELRKATLELAEEIGQQTREGKVVSFNVEVERANEF